MHLRDGFITQADGDMGDTAHRHGWLQLNAELRFILKLPQPQDFGVMPYVDATHRLQMPQKPVRSPYPPHDNPKDFSRDQAIPNICTVVLKGWSWDSSTWKKLLEQNGHRFPNGDVATFQIYNLFRETPSALGMFELLCNVVLCSLKVRINSDDVDNTINTFALFATAAVRSPKSKWIKVMRWVFNNIHSGVQRAINYYFDPQFGGNPELGEIYNPVVRLLLGGNFGRRT